MDESAFVSLVLGAARIDGYDSKVFSIGPFGIRVGFAFQQQRALNLVHALIKMPSPIQPNQKILIVGAGLAGLTAKLALHGLQFQDVHLIESHDRPIKTQHAATHRLIHPSYNSWPIANHFSATSNLPFLNWFTATAGEVSAFLSERWDTLYATRVSKIHLEAKLVNVLKLARSKKMNVTKVEAVIEENGKQMAHLFDYVILATGFGEERHLKASSSGSYWEEDEVISLSQKQEDTRDIFVSGTGDGGLMDLIRLGYNNDPAKDLSMEVINSLRHASYHLQRTDFADTARQFSATEQTIRTIENAAANMLPQAARQRQPFGNQFENRIAKDLESGYRAAIRSLPAGTLEILSKRLNRKLVFSNRLKLIGSKVTPFTINTAPINKLLVAFLLEQNPAIFVRGQIDTDTMTLTAYDKTTTDIGKAVVILRHGGQAPAYKIAKNFGKQNIGLNRAMSDLVDLQTPDHVFCGGLGDIVSPDPTTPVYGSYRVKLASSFAERNLRKKLTKELGKTENDEPIWFELPVLNDEEVKGIADRLGGFPHEIFGVKLLVAGRRRKASNGLRRS